MAALFAATHPERTLALVMYGALVALRWSPETPWASNWREMIISPGSATRVWRPRSPCVVTRVWGWVA